MFADPSKVHRLDHRGAWFRTRGPFTVPRTPQGRPVIIQAGQSGRGRRFAVRWGEVVFVNFEGRTVEYDFADLDELQLAYACTIHKGQGSEYPAVVIPLHSQHYVMLQRNLLYTGITRGRRLVALVGSRRALWRAVTNAETKKRFSLLKWRLQQTDDEAQNPVSGFETGFFPD